MSEKKYPYALGEITSPRLGLVALQSDETIEGDMRRLLPADVELMVTRVASAEEVTRDTLGEMEQHLTTAAGLFPVDVKFDVVGYGCTSGTAQIGANQIAAKVRAGTACQEVTQPLSALLAACKALNLKRLAFLSPYVGEVSARLREALAENGIETPVFGSFDIGVEATVVRIDGPSIVKAALDLVDDTAVDGLFLSCTNLRTLHVVDALEAQLNMPVLSSNQVMAWHMLRLSDLRSPPGVPGRLFRT